MTTQDLDRLVTRTAMTPVSKRALRDVRRAVMSGTIGDATVGRASWSVSMDTAHGLPVTMTFSFRREN